MGIDRASQALRVLHRARRVAQEPPSLVREVRRRLRRDVVGTAGTQTRDRRGEEAPRAPGSARSDAVCFHVQGPLPRRRAVRERHRLVVVQTLPGGVTSPDITRRTVLGDAYDQSVYAPSQRQVTGRYVTNSEAVRARLGAPQRFAYGPTPIEGLDVYATRRANTPINVFIHGGAWRVGAAKDYAFPAELFVNAGAHFVVPDFAAVQDLDGDLMPMAGQVRRAIAWVHRNAKTFGGDPDRIYLSGHSSGAHLAGVALITDWRKDFDLPADIVKGGLCCSGMFDLKPVRLSARSRYVKFTDSMEDALSAQRHLDRLHTPLILAHGTL